VSVRHLDRIRAAVLDAGADALWVHPALDFRYLTGLAPLAVERPTALVILAGGLRVLAPEMLAPELEGLGDVVAWSDGEGPDAAIARVLDGVGRCLIEPDLPSGVAFALRAARPGLELVLDPGILTGLRERKAPDELEPLRAAGAEADEAMAWIAGAELEGRSERSLALELQARFLGRGVDPYPGYVIAAGANGALPHHETGETPIAADAPLLTDFGCSVGGYHSDITRVHLPAGDGGEAAEAYAIARAAHDAVIAGLEPGLPCQEADRLARDVIAAAGYGERFIHRTGHGVGLEIHEEPRVAASARDTLAPGSVVTVEPGVYLPGVGGVRIEDTVVVTPDGSEPLTASPKHLVI
jgi:Xaa-Pro aminopeptidase